MPFLNAEDRGGASTTGLPSFTVSQAATELLRAGLSWSNPQGQGTSVSFAFRSTAASSDYFTGLGGFERLSETQIGLALSALTVWSDVAGISFQRVGAGTQGEGAFSNAATMVIGGYTTSTVTFGGIASFPGSRDPSSKNGDIWINHGNVANSDESGANSSYYAVLLHEIGHAIGLSHPGAYNGGGASYETSAGYAEDNYLYSTRSYFRESEVGGDFGFHPAGTPEMPTLRSGNFSATPMMDDIAAVQRLYGANLSTRSGDTIYGFNSNADRAWYRLTSEAQVPVYCIWDGGGFDTLDFSGFRQDQLIDLRPGSFSNVGGDMAYIGDGRAVGNVSIAVGVMLEAARGGAGSDTIVGNDAANLLSGNGGDDMLQGGRGSDVASYAAQASDFDVSYRGDGAWSVIDRRSGAPAGRDELLGVETVRFTDRDLTIGAALSVALENSVQSLLRAHASSPEALATSLVVASRVASGASTAGAIQEIVKAADATTSVATLSYQFFTGRIPTAAGLDYLVSPTGPNPNNLNSAYFQSFNLENRYINFAVNLGKLGEGRADFIAEYGGLSLASATKKAYGEIFGAAPTDAKVAALLGGGRDLYFASYGGDGPSGIGTKAAMVGWLLAEAEKANLGVYAKSNAAFLTDLADGATYNIDLIGAYGRPEYTYLGG